MKKNWKQKLANQIKKQKAQKQKRDEYLMRVLDLSNADLKQLKKYTSPEQLDFIIFSHIQAIENGDVH